MPKGIPNKRYTPEFKKMVIETMQGEELGYRETAQRFENRSDRQVRNWERIYLTEGPEVFAVERRGAGVDRLFGLLQQPQNQGKAKRLAACNTPVSYTHLDVYKRQGLDMPGGEDIVWILRC